MKQKMKKITIHSTLPNELENLIVEFSYFPICTLNGINSLATLCWVHSRNLPTPRSWKKLLSHENSFKWKVFLKTCMIPYSPHTLISLREVRNTIRMLNWHIIKSTHTIATRYFMLHTKKNILHKLAYWGIHSSTLIFLIQRLLCSLDFPHCLNKSDIMNYNSCLISNQNPLCMYLHPPSDFL